MSQPLPFHEIKFDRNVSLEDLLNILDDSDIRYFLEVDLRYPHNIRQKTKHFPFAPENKIKTKSDFKELMKKIRPEKHTPHKKLICDWTEKKKYLILYRMVKIYFRHGMVAHKVHEINSFRQSKCLEKYIKFSTQNKNQAVNDFEKHFYKLLNNAF